MCPLLPLMLLTTGIRVLHNYNLAGMPILTCVQLCAAGSVYGTACGLHCTDLCGLQNLVELLSCPHNLLIDNLVYISLERRFLLL